MLVVLFAALFSLALVACGDDDGGIEADDTTTTTKAEEGGDEGGDDDTDTTDDDGGEFDPDARAELPDGQQPGDLGDGPAFDALAESCFDGDMAACDILYLETPVDSNSEAYGDTCGGREEEADSSADCSTTYDWVAPDPQQPGELGSDDDLDALAQECFEGDFGDCEDLYSESEVGSDYEAYALTCGGRLPAVALDELSSGNCDTYYSEATPAS
jgi:hypothetical protein